MNVTLVTSQFEFPYVHVFPIYGLKVSNQGRGGRGQEGGDRGEGAGKGGRGVGGGERG